ncbi:hypothetical protein [Dyadobacter sandarakinus]|uniref:Glutathione synthase/RimK-type ligase, ATP-grasp superfamily n=1 Tax=Dyadobacter sandarakinus TaxID=2747268 RepID=A0ABX7IED6_9BACT|nr:hypothetical protein [Dyadobacter sandarakinus]QRR03892.1 hypothetical protein HWI92_24760 [Dyadobacter sandarakinus]
MNAIEILGVHRNRKYSPNHIGNDDAIFSLTARELEKMGCKVSICCENEFLDMQEVPFERIFTMARQKEVVSRMQQLESNGMNVVNSAFGIENCFRTNLTNALNQHQIPVADSYIVPTSYQESDVFEKITGKGYWIKRGDFHAIHKEDVSFAATIGEAKEILREYALREIPDAVISEHLVGDLVKFYGVRGTDFFFWFYPYDRNHHKYSDYQAINGGSKYYQFSEADLHEVAGRAAGVVGIDIYGGDAIVSKDGTFRIIDLNDWPSFAPCRDEAAGFIADRLYQKFTNQH